MRLTSWRQAAEPVDVLVVCTGNLCRSPIMETLLASMKLGTTYVPLNYRLAEPEIQTLVGAARSRWIFVSERYVEPATFKLFEAQAAAMGFRHAAIGAMVRSSYHADQQAHEAGVT